MSRNTGELAITDVVALTGTTSRPLRHYDAVGLLRPSQVGPGGQRFYDRDSLIRLQRILLMRDLRLGLPAIADVLARQVGLAATLAEHVTWLRGERRRIGRQLASVQRTLDAIREDTDMDTTQMFDGFNHSEHREEVEGKWGKEAFARGNAWWEA